MGNVTGISWTDSTWNFLRGCTRDGAECVNCYAEIVSARYSGIEPDGKLQPYHGLAMFTPSGEARWTNKVITVPRTLDQPLRWQKGRLIFVNSMSDVWHKDVDDADIRAMFGVCALAQQHVFQFLTKRPERMAPSVLEMTLSSVLDEVRERIEKRLFDKYWALYGKTLTWPLRNVWLGTSTGRQDSFDSNYEFLLDTPGMVLFLSMEPLIGEVDMRPALTEMARPTWDKGKLGWVIAGGESGNVNRIRRMDWAWIERIQADCREFGIPYFFKQTGEILAREMRLQSRHGSDMNELPEKYGIHEFPKILDEFLPERRYQGLVAAPEQEAVLAL